MKIELVNGKTEYVSDAVDSKIHDGVLIVFRYDNKPVRFPLCNVVRYE